MKSKFSVALALHRQPCIRWPAAALAARTSGLSLHRASVSPTVTQAAPTLAATSTVASPVGPQSIVLSMHMRRFSAIASPRAPSGSPSLHVSQTSLDKLVQAKSLLMKPTGAATSPSAEAIAEAKQLVAAAIAAEAGAQTYSDSLLSTLAGRSKAHLCLTLWMVEVLLVEVLLCARDFDALAHVLTQVSNGLLAEFQKPEHSEEAKHWRAVAFTLVKARLVRCHGIRYKSGGAFQATLVGSEALQSVAQINSLDHSMDGIEAQALLMLRYTEALQLFVSLQVVAGKSVPGDIFGYVAERADNYARLMSMLMMIQDLDPRDTNSTPSPPLPAILDEMYPRSPLSFTAIHAETYKNAGKAYRYLLDHVEGTGETIDEVALELETEVSVDGVAELFDCALNLARHEPDNRDCRTTAAVALQHLVKLYTDAGRKDEADKANAQLVQLQKEGNLDESQIIPL